jgi:hypothetical protein
MLAHKHGLLQLLGLFAAIPLGSEHLIRVHVIMLCWLLHPYLRLDMKGCMYSMASSRSE